MGAAASEGAVAITRAGGYPTPSRPRSPSEPTCRRIAPRATPGRGRASSRMAAHFASPTVSPVASIDTSSLMWREATPGTPSPSSALAAGALSAHAAWGPGHDGARPAGGRGILPLAAVSGVGWWLLRRCARATAGRGVRAGHQAPRDEALSGRPQVRRQPVDHQAGGEVDDEGDEDDRQREQQVALHLGHRRAGRHVVGRGQLARDVDDEQERSPRVFRRLRDVDEAQEVEAVAEVLRSARDLLLEVAEREEQGDEDRELEQDRQAGGGRVDLVLPVELHQLLVLPLLVVLPALLDLLHLRRVHLEVLHGVDLPHHHGHEEDPHHDDERDDRPGPRQADRVVEPLEDSGEDVLEGRENACDDHVSSPRRRLKTVWSRTWSTPPCDHGLQRSSRQQARTEPRNRPSSRNASTAYCEQLGWYLHVPAGVSRPSVRRHTWTAATPTNPRPLMRVPSRAPRPPARRAIPGRACPRAPRCPPARPARSRGRTSPTRRPRARSRAAGA